MPLLWRVYEGAWQGSHTSNVVIYSVVTLPHNRTLRLDKGLHQESRICPMVRASQPRCERNGSIPWCCGYTILQPQALVAQMVCAPRHHAPSRNHRSTWHTRHDVGHATSYTWPIYEACRCHMRNTSCASARHIPTYWPHQEASKQSLTLYKFTEHGHVNIAKIVDDDIGLCVTQELTIEGCG